MYLYVYIIYVFIYLFEWSIYLSNLHVYLSTFAYLSLFIHLFNRIDLLVGEKNKIKLH